MKLYPVYCSWCTKKIGTSTTENSHGICKKCKKEQDKLIEKLRKGE